MYEVYDADKINQMEKYMEKNKKEICCPSPKKKHNDISDIMEDAEEFYKNAQTVQNNETLIEYWRGALLGICVCLQHGPEYKKIDEMYEHITELSYALRRARGA